MMARWQGITRNARDCKRPARYHLIRANGTCAKHYCGAHAEGKGVMKYLRPAPWEYDHVESYAYDEGAK